MNIFLCSYNSLLERGQFVIISDLSKHLHLKNLSGLKPAISRVLAIPQRNKAGEKGESHLRGSFLGRGGRGINNDLKTIHRLMLRPLPFNLLWNLSITHSGHLIREPLYVLLVFNVGMGFILYFALHCSEISFAHSSRSVLKQFMPLYLL